MAEVSTPSTRPRKPSADFTTFFPDTDPAIDNSKPPTMSNSATNPHSITDNTTPPLHPSTQTLSPNTDLNRSHGSNTTTTTTSSTPPPAILTNASNTIHIELTHAALSPSFATQYTRSPTAGATVLFLGTTRSYFQDPTRPVSRLSYTSYTPLALRTLLRIAEEVQTKHDLERVCIIHRLGEVAVAEESIVVAVSSAHRGAGWRGAEELLELVKKRAEIWKREWFVDGAVEVGRDGERGVQVKAEVGVWRDNRESDAMGRRREMGPDGGEGR